MDGERFDRLAKVLADKISRRGALRGLIGLGAAGIASTFGSRSAESACGTSCPRCLRGGEFVLDPRPNRGTPPPLSLPYGGPATNGRIPRLTGGPATCCHSDSFYNEYYALDFGAQGAEFPVLAAAGGTVKRIKWEGTALVVFIAHGDVWQTKYGHLKDGSVTVGVGDPVVAGQQIATAGMTGASSIHLHFELRDGAGRYDTSCNNWTFEAIFSGAASPPPTCPSGQLRCNDRCVSTACSGGQVFNRDACQCECRGRTTSCDGSCIDTSSDANNCGGCGNRCSGGSSCRGGRCICSNDLALCGTACIDTRTSSTNCGGCGRTCRGDQFCSNGRCGCPPGTEECNGACLDHTTLQYDPNNCGACGTACGEGNACFDGVCTGAVSARIVDVDGSTVNALPYFPFSFASRFHLYTSSTTSVCGNQPLYQFQDTAWSVPPGTYFLVANAPPGYFVPPQAVTVSPGRTTHVDMRVRDTTVSFSFVDRDNQTAITGYQWRDATQGSYFSVASSDFNVVPESPLRDCRYYAMTADLRHGDSNLDGIATLRGLAPGQYFVHGAIHDDHRVQDEATFDLPESGAASVVLHLCGAQFDLVCDYTCIDPLYNPAHCGACGNACLSNLCIEGQCAPVCEAGFDFCGSACVDTSNDPAHCGACDQACSTGMCADGACVCLDGTEFCNGTCVTVTTYQTDPNNCGGCGNTCPSGANCVDGSCVGGCPDGTVSCGEGACASATDPLSCGCGSERCPVGEDCIAGVCSCGGNASNLPNSCCEGDYMCGQGPSFFIAGVEGQCPFGSECPTGYTPCVGTVCNACCPDGTTCEPEGYCRR